jgi:hypothetical protein
MCAIVIDPNKSLVAANQIAKATRAAGFGRQTPGPGGYCHYPVEPSKHAVSRSRRAIRS